jgi:geranylgeranyl pyrophosphate synthase
MKMEKESRKGSSAIPKKGKLSGKKLSRYIEENFEKRGKKALEMARKAVLEEERKLECEEARKALHYFMNSFWNETTRPALLSIACETLNGNPDATTPIAVPLILISGAVDIHDDMIDQTKIKKGYPTVYGKFGKDMALLVGDALLFKGFTLLHEASKKLQPEQADTIYKLIKESFYELGDAESLELSLKRRKDLKIEEYLDFVQKKAADFEAYMCISAILANGSEREIETLGKYGRILGMLAILGDDNADMLDPLGMVNRIKNEILPLPMIYALHVPGLKKKLRPLLQKKKLTEEDTERVLDLIYNAGVFNDVEGFLKKLISKGKETLKFIGKPPLLIKILESTYPE